MYAREFSAIYTYMYTDKNLSIVKVVICGKYINLNKIINI